MKIHHYPETDSLYIALSDRPSVDAVEVAEGVVADLDATGRVIGLDIDQASQHLDLKTLETVDFPLPKGA